MDKFVKECFVNDVLHYQALKIWKKIEAGDEVKLEYDEKKSEEVKITSTAKKTENKVVQEGLTIGYLSKDDSKLIVDIINCRSKDDIFYGLISAVEQKNEENKRIKVAVFIKGN